jgi:DNA polymerase III delta subunit
MFYFIYGNNKEKAREKAHELLDIMKSKRPNSAYVQVDSDSFSVNLVDELLATQGLFDHKNIVFLDGVMSNAENKKTVLERVKMFKESDNAFVILETTATKEVLKKFEKTAEKIIDCDEDVEKKESPSLFALADALGRRDRKGLWMGIISAFKDDSVPEELHGILFWQVKSMILANTSKDAKEAGLNPYVFTKAKGFARNFKDGELENISRTLVAMYHDSHRGKRDFKLALEQFALSI